MSYLRYLCLFAYSCVQHILCCVFALFFCVLSVICCQFLWIVHSVFSNVYFAINLPLPNMVVVSKVKG